MVRVWRPDDNQRPEGVRGIALHLGSGHQITFADSGRLIRFLSAASRGDGPPFVQTSSETTDQE